MSVSVSAPSLSSACLLVFLLFRQTHPRPGPDFEGGLLRRTLHRSRKREGKVCKLLFEAPPNRSPLSNVLYSCLGKRCCIPIGRSSKPSRGKVCPCYLAEFQRMATVSKKYSSSDGGLGVSWKSAILIGGPSPRPFQRVRTYFPFPSPLSPLLIRKIWKLLPRCTGKRWRKDC